MAMAILEMLSRFMTDFQFHFFGYQDDRTVFDLNAIFNTRNEDLDGLLVQAGEQVLLAFNKFDNGDANDLSLTWAHLPTYTLPLMNETRYLRWVICKYNKKLSNDIVLDPFKFVGNRKDSIETLKQEFNSLMKLVYKLEKAASGTHFYVKRFLEVCQRHGTDERDRMKVVKYLVDLSDYIPLLNPQLKAFIEHQKQLLQCGPVDLSLETRDDKPATGGSRLDELD